MHQKKILVIGNSDSIFVRDFCSKISNTGIIVDAFSINKGEIIESIRAQYSAADQNIKSKNRLCRVLSLQKNIINTIKEIDSHYDCIVIHYVDYRLAISIKKILKKTRKLVTVVWGSDFYRSTRYQKFLQNRIFKNSSAIVFTNPLTADNFKKNNINLDGIPLKIARFGLPVLDEIKTLRVKNIARGELCKYFEIPAEKVIILAGYNANPVHNHDLIIEEFSKINESIKEKAYLVFPLGYGEKKTIDKIKSLLEKNRVFNYKILEKFYNFHDTAKLRCITDILINIQPSDQFSGSMQETLYAGGRIIAGSWLPYSDILNAGAPIKLINKPNNIGEAIEFEIEAGISHEKFGNSSIRHFIDKSSSWDENLKVWQKIMFE